MNQLKYLAVLVISILTLNVHANTCSYKEQSTLNNDFSHVKIIYEMIDDDTIDIIIYNITENIFVSYKNFDTGITDSIYYYDTENGKYIITRNVLNVEDYKFEIRSNISACYGNVLTTKKITKPKYNEYHTLDICKEDGLKNHTYCQKYITQDIKKSRTEVVEALQDFLNSRVEKIPKVEKEKKIDIKTIIKYSSIGLIITTIIVVSILIYKKRSEL